MYRVIVGSNETMFRSLAEVLAWLQDKAIGYVPVYDYDYRRIFTARRDGMGHWVVD
jgi:hypothetical protein